MFFLLIKKIYIDSNKAFSYKRIYYKVFNLTLKNNYQTHMKTPTQKSNFLTGSRLEILSTLSSA